MAGGGGQSYVVGYKYYVGMHFVLIQGIADKVIRIRVDERDLWVGSAIDRQLSTSRETLFGGVEREGGVSGNIDLASGNIDQVQNSYLVSKLGSLVPAFRGVTSAILRQVYVGMNPYLKKWDFRVQRIHKRYDGIPQWQDRLSEIKVCNFKHPNQICIAVDCSGSMDNAAGTGTRLDTAKQSICAILDTINDIRKTSSTPVDICIIAWASTFISYTRRNVDDDDITDLKGFVNNLNAFGGTNFESAFEGANEFFGTPEMEDTDTSHPLFTKIDRTMFFVTDGAPTHPVENAIATGSDLINQDSGLFNGATGTEVNIYGINIDENTSETARVINTGEPYVINASSSVDELYIIIWSLLGSFGAMNPVHIIRECLTDPDWGMGYGDDDIDEDSFYNAAYTMIVERLGMCIKWQRETSIGTFIQDIKRHINAELYVSRTTGKFVIKLIRGDYDENNLITLDESNIQKISNYKRPAFGELVNSVSVNYWSIDLGDTATVTVQDIALVQQQKNIIQTTVNYDGFVCPETASRIAQRDLTVLSTPLVSCTVYANRDAEDLNIGDVFRLTWPDYAIDDMVMRVTGINYGDGRNNTIQIQCNQDVFSLPTRAFVSPPNLEWVDPTRDAEPAVLQEVYEMPYLELVRRFGEMIVSDVLGSEPLAGYVGAFAVRPTTSTLKAKMMTDSGSGYKHVGNADFCPVAILQENITETETTIIMSDEYETENISIGSWFQIGEELLVVEEITGNTITVKRGALDTLVSKHQFGDTIVFWDMYSGYDETEYIESDSVSVKLLTVTGGGELPLASAPVMNIELNARAFRPYPPGNLKFNSTYFPENTYTGEITLTWASRNRLQQTGGVIVGFTDDSITSEPGVTYTVRVRDEYGNLLSETTGISTLTHTVSLVNNGVYIIEICSVRDAYESRTYSHRINYEALFARISESGEDTRITDQPTQRTV